MSRRRWMVLGGSCLMIGLSGPGCAHKRQVYYPNTTTAEPAVRVRAPFVDIQVPRQSRVGDPDDLD
jgi:hypothetical protein